MAMLLVILGLSFCLTVVLTPVARRCAFRWGLVDQPDGRRKIHAGPIPLAGGLVILAAATGALLPVLLVPNPFQDELTQQGPMLLGLFLSAVTLCAVGLADDFLGLHGRHKLLGQLAAISIVLASGLLVRKLRLFHWEVELGLLALPFTVCWLLGSINSLNLIDGMDGLLSCMGLIISLAMALMAAVAGQWVAACTAVALAGALIGFLLFNLPPASIFLGDCGSMVIGLVVGVLAIQSSLKTPATVALAAPLTILTIPFFDTAAAIIRRKLTGRSIYATDRGHLHHCLLRRGFSTHGALMCISFCCLSTVGGALASLAFNNELFALPTAAAVIAILIGTRVFGYPELLLAKECLRTSLLSFFQRSAHGNARQVAVRLQGSIEWQQLWTEIITFALQSRLRLVCLDVNIPALQEGYHASWGYVEEDGENPNLWRAEIPLVLSGQPIGRLRVVGDRDQESVWREILAFQKIVETLEMTMVHVAFSSPNGAPSHGVSSNGLSAHGTLHGSLRQRCDPAHTAAYRRHEDTERLPPVAPAPVDTNTGKGRNGSLHP